jgi:hypothetical protein
LFSFKNHNEFLSFTIHGEFFSNPQKKKSFIYQQDIIGLDISQYFVFDKMQDNKKEIDDDTQFQVDKAI